MNKKNILAVNFFPAFTPPKSGGELRYFNLYKNLGQRYNVTLLSPTHPFIPAEKIEIAPNVFNHRIPKTMAHVRTHQFFEKIGNFTECSAAVVAISTWFHKEFLETLKEHVKNSDIIICEFPFIAHFIKANQQQVFIYNSYNVEYYLHRNMLKGMFGGLIARYIKYLEKKTCEKVDAVFATCDDDSNNFNKLYHIPQDKIFVIPNGVDSIELKPESDKEKLAAKTKLGFNSVSPIVIFFGSAHPPNKEAVDFILNELSPKHRDLNFIIAGSCSTNIDKKKYTNVHPYGIVSDEEKMTLLKATDIAINPMFSGSGTNLKMLDYMAMGKPIVSTPLGARGIDLRNKKDAVIVSSEKFSEGIMSILSDKSFMNFLRINSRKVAEEKYDWNNISFKMESIIERIYEEKNNRH